MLCLSCEKNEAVKNSVLGWLPCLECQNSEVKPTLKYEFTSQAIRQERREYRKDIIQPFRDNILSKEFLEEYGTTGIDVTKEDIKNAQYVWDDLPGWADRDKGKGGRSNKWRDKNIDPRFKK